MKIKRNIKRTVAFVLLCALCVGIFTGCKNDADKIVLELEEPNEKITATLDKSFMNLWIADLNYRYSFLTEQFGFDKVMTDDNKTLGQVIVTDAVTSAKNMLAAEYVYDYVEGFDFGEEQNAVVDEVMVNIVAQYGSEAILKDELAKSGSDMESLRRYLVLEFKCRLLYNMLFETPDSKYAVTEKELKERFERDYRIAEMILFDTRGTLKDDGTIEPYSEEKIKEIEALATSVYDAIISGEATFEDMQDAHNQDAFEQQYPFGYFVTNDTTYPEEFTSAVMSMKDNEIRLVKVPAGYQIVRKNPMNPELYKSNGNFSAMLAQTVSVEKFQNYIESATDYVTVNEDVAKELDPSSIAVFPLSEIFGG